MGAAPAESDRLGGPATLIVSAARDRTIEPAERPGARYALPARGAGDGTQRRASERSDGRAILAAIEATFPQSARDRVRRPHRSRRSSLSSPTYRRGPRAIVRNTLTYGNTSVPDQA